MFHPQSMDHQLPADRFESARAFAAALADPSFATSGAHASTPRYATRDWRATAAVPALALVVGLLAMVGWMASRPSSPERVSRYEMVWAGAGAAPPPPRQPARAGGAGGIGYAQAGSVGLVWALAEPTQAPDRVATARMASARVMITLRDGVGRAGS